MNRILVPAVLRLAAGVRLGYRSPMRASHESSRTMGRATKLMLSLPNTSRRGSAGTNLKPVETVHSESWSKLGWSTGPGLSTVTVWPSDLMMAYFQLRCTHYSG